MEPRQRGRPPKNRGRPRGRPRIGRLSTTSDVNDGSYDEDDDELDDFDLQVSSNSTDTATTTQQKSRRSMEEEAEKIYLDIVAKVTKATRENSPQRECSYKIWSEYTGNPHGVRKQLSVEKSVSAANIEVEKIFYNRNPWVFICFSL